ncbi:MAG: argininosuccinate lyase [Phycisphaerales bacterium]|nr:argininosuccinate lyase [Phycisphaerales bacterium]
MTTAVWSGRFSQASDPLFKKFNDSLPFDRTLVHEDIEGSVAWAGALLRGKVLTAAEHERLVDALKAVGDHARANPDLLTTATDEDVHSWVERELVARVGDLGKKLHTGRSRNDQVSTDLRLWTGKELTARRGEIEAAIEAFLRLAERERDTVFPGYTHLQRAQPILFAHWCLAYVEMLARDADRLSDCARRTNVSPLGSGALAGTAYPIDRVALAESMGFASASANSLDAVSDRDFVVESLSAASLCAIHLSRFAEDLIFYTTGEAGLIELSEAVTSGSSLMPQKKNPDALELIRGKTGRQIGNLVSLLVTIKGLPLAYNKDLQEDKEPLFDSMEHLSLCLRMVPIVLDGLVVNRDRARAAAIGGYANATELADYLVGKGVPFRQAHHTVGRLVREAIQQRKALEELTVEQMAAIEPSITHDVYTALTIDSALRVRDVAGGTAPNRVAATVAAQRKRLGQRRLTTPLGGITLRHARMDDLDGIVALVELWAARGENLPRSREEILECLSEFAVAVRDNRVVGCGSLLIYTPQLAEIRSLGIDPAHHGHGVGSKMVRYFVDWAAKLKIPKVFVLTRAPKFFDGCGFTQVSVNSLPEKVLKDCAKCPRNTCCDETAMVLDTLSERGSSGGR